MPQVKIHCGNVCGTHTLPPYVTLPQQCVWLWRQRKDDQISLVKTKQVKPIYIKAFTFLSLGLR